jgi:4-hydroxybenzoate polyprenyltransferase
MNTDINFNGWILKFIPEKYRPYAILARLDRPVGIWLLLLPALWGITLASAVEEKSWIGALVLMIIFALGAVVMRAAGCIINDIWDRKLDAGIERTKLRPLASGEIPLENALIFLSMLLMAGLIVLLLLSGTAIMLGILVVPLIIAYPFMKRLTFWPQAFLGLTFNFGALIGWAAVADSLGLPAVFLYLAGMFWTLGYDTVYAHQDKEDDAVMGVKSTALLFGAESKRWVSGFYGACWIFLGLAMIAAGLPLYAYAGLLAAGAHLMWQIRRWNVESAESALRVFKSNTAFGLIVFVTFLAAFLG